MGRPGTYIGLAKHTGGSAMSPRRRPNSRNFGKMISNQNMGNGGGIDAEAFTAPIACPNHMDLYLR